METPWYQDGLRFRCTHCGRCCGGAPGYVWVDESNIRAIAEYVGQSFDEFTDRYVRRVGHRLSLIEKMNNDCIFLDANKTCSIYAVRPPQCRSWPFWESNVRTSEDWKRTCEVCPGSGQGDLIPVEEISRNLQMIRI